MKTKSILRHFVSIGMGTVINMLVGVITTPILTRMVGTSEYGQYSILTMYANIALMILCMGFDQALIRYFYRFESADYQRTILRECVILPMVFTVCGGVIVNVLCWFNVVELEFEPIIVTLLTFMVLFQVLNRIDLILLRVTYQTKLYSSLQVLLKLLFAFLAIVGCFVFKTRLLLALTGASVLSYVIVTVIGIKSQSGLWNFREIKEVYHIDRKELCSYAFPFIISMGVTTLFQAIDKISLNRYCSYEEVGIYASALTLIHVFAIVQTTFGSVWAPLVVEHYEKDQHDRVFYQRGFKTISFVMFVMGISLILCKDLFAILLGKDYRSAATMLPFLCLSPMMLTISEATVVGITFSQKSYLQIVVSAVACVSNILGNTMLVPIYGGIGAAISTGISYIIFFLMRTFVANRYFRVKWGMGRFGIATALFLGYALYNTFMPFNLGVVLGYVVLLSVLLIMYRDVVRDCVQMVKNIFP